MGAGARAGVTLKNQIYLGLTFVYHLGFSNIPNFEGPFSEHVYYPGAEVGYDFRVQRYTLRPYLGFADELV